MVTALYQEFHASLNPILQHPPKGPLEYLVHLYFE